MQKKVTIFFLIAALILTASSLSIIAYSSYQKLQSKLSATKTKLATLEKEKKKWGSIKSVLAMNNSYLRYFTTQKTDKDTVIFSQNIKDFIPIDEVSLKKILPPLNESSTALAYKNSPYVWFGARIFKTQNNNKPEFLALSYYGNGNTFHHNKSFNSLLTNELLTNAHKKIQLEEEHNLKGVFLEEEKDSYTKGTSFLPTSYNSADIDQDGQADFILGKRLYLSSQQESYFSTNQNLLSKETFSKDSVFIKYNKTSILASLNKGVVSFWGYNLDIESLTPLYKVQLNFPFKNKTSWLQLFPVKDIDGDGGDELAVIDDNYISFLLSSSGYKKITKISGFNLKSELVQGEKVIKRLNYNENHINIGANGDFDSDGINDVWIVERTYRGHLGRATLISGKKIINPKIPGPFSSCELYGSDKYTNVEADGLGASISPIAGDIDKDGIPDLTISGHFHLNYTGALYVLLGKDIKKDCSYNITDSHIIKVAGPPLGNLAPRQTHYDDNDFNHDGYDDIIIAADNDMESGINSGAVYIIDGKKLIIKYKERD